METNKEEFDGRACRGAFLARAALGAFTLVMALTLVSESCLAQSYQETTSFIRENLINNARIRINGDNDADFHGYIYDVSFDRNFYGNFDKQYEHPHLSGK
jgi:hypothetical protein